MEKVQGIGGFFFRAREPEFLAAWYEKNLGINPVPTNTETRPWEQEAGMTVFSPFPEDTEYFGRRGQQFMLNFRVANLDAMLEQLREAGAEVDDEIQEMEFVGRFGWAADPEGNRFELWEPED